jgi:cell division protein FtsN
MARDDYKRQKNAKQHGGAIRHVVGLFASFLCGYLVANVFDLPSVVAWVNHQWVTAQSGNVNVEAENAADKPVKQATLPKPKFEFYTLLSKDTTAATSMPRGVPGTATSTIPGSQIAAAAPITSGTSQQQPVTSATQQGSSGDQLAEKAPSVVNQDTTGAPASNLSVPVAESKPVLESKPIGAGAESPVAKLAGKETYMIQVAAVTRRQDAERLKASLTLKGYSVMIISPTQPQAKVTWFRVVIGPFHSRADAERAQVNVARTEHIQGMIRKVDV